MLSETALAALHIDGPGAVATGVPAALTASPGSPIFDTVAIWELAKPRALTRGTAPRARKCPTPHVLRRAK